MSGAPLSILPFAVRVDDKKPARSSVDERGTDDMAKLTVMMHLTLDGVLQAPGRADEDRRGGFAHGGWAQPGNDPVMGDFLATRMATTEPGSLLFGRRTYED